MARFLLVLLLLFFLAPVLLPALAVCVGLLFAAGAVLLASAVVGVVFGAVVALIALPFKLAFGFFCA